MKKGEEIKLRIETFEFPNKGTGYVDQTRVVVKNALPGQTVKAIVSKKRKNKIEARLVEVCDKAPYELEPVCNHFGKCGGCLLQTMPYEMQLQHKDTYVQQTLSTVTAESYHYRGIVPSPNQLRYRNKMEFSFGDSYKGGPLSLGLHQRNRFYEIETTDTCQLVDGDFTKILRAVLAYFSEKKTPFYHKKTHEGYLRHLVIRKGEFSNELMINLVTTSQEELDETGFVSSVLDLNLSGVVQSMIHTTNDRLGDVVQPDDMKLLYGSMLIKDKLLGLTFEISPFSFFQTNSSGAEKLYEIVRRYAGTKSQHTILDLYCGTGTIAQILSPIAKKVIGVELVHEAIEKARENANLNGITNCEFVQGDVLKVVDTLPDNADIVVLDPPRSGIHPKAINKIISFEPETFIYISCNPKALSQDLPTFLEAGYRIEESISVDMFPMVTHVEVCCCLTRVK